MKWPKKNLLVLSLSLSVLLGSHSGGYASAATIPEAATPLEPSWGYFVDNYKNNSKDNMSITSNPAIGVLSEYYKLWTPGASWDTGTKLNSELLDANIQKVVDMTTHRTAGEAEAAYFDDR